MTRNYSPLEIDYDRARKVSPPIKPILALLTTTLLAVGATACGAGTVKAPASPVSSEAQPPGGTTTAPASIASSGGYLKNDGDKDFDDPENGHGGGDPEYDESMPVAPFRR